MEGVKVVEEGQWIYSPKDAIILGLKELFEANWPLWHSHVYFGHCFKVRFWIPKTQISGTKSRSCPLEKV
jgi:saccharopine dehydrogenase (NAD+, L-lysine-forming)